MGRQERRRYQLPSLWMSSQREDLEVPVRLPASRGAPNGGCTHVCHVITQQACAETSTGINSGAIEEGCTSAPYADVRPLAMSAPAAIVGGPPGAVPQ